MRINRRSIVIIVGLLTVFFSWAGTKVGASELDYMGLELGATWFYEITEFNIENETTHEETAKLTRQVVAVDKGTRAGITSYTIQETRTDKDGTHCREFKLSKNSSGVYYAMDGDELHLVFETPLQKNAKSMFSISSWSEQNVSFWGQVSTETPLGEDDAWLGKEWIQYDDGSYVERTVEFVPYIGFIYEGKLERLFPDGCS